MQTSFADRDPAGLVYIDMPDPDEPGIPHELEGFNRMNRNGMSGAQIMELFRDNNRPMVVVEKMQKGLDDEAAAKYLDMPIYDDGIDPEKATA